MFVSKNVPLISAQFAEGAVRAPFEIHRRLDKSFDIFDQQRAVGFKNRSGLCPLMCGKAPLFRLSVPPLQCGCAAELLLKMKAAA